MQVIDLTRSSSSSSSSERRPAKKAKPSSPPRPRDVPPERDWECPICYQEFSKKNAYKVLLPCRHVICSGCFGALNKNKAPGTRVSCPIDRREVTDHKPLKKYVEDTPSSVKLLWSGGGRR